MRVFRYRTDASQFRWLHSEEDAIRYAADDVFDGTPRCEMWVPFEVWWNRDSERTKGDFPNWILPVVSSRVVATMGGVLSRFGELLPLVSSDGEFFVYNVTSVVDCLDEDASVVERYSSGRIMWINKHVFDPTLVGGNEVFILPQFSRAAVYVTDAFLNRVANAGLSGLEPVEVWSAEDGPRWLEMF